VSAVAREPGFGGRGGVIGIGHRPRELPLGAVPALLDLLLLYTMRTWLETTAQPIGWAQALRDPALSAALRAIQERPAEPWTVASLAREASLSRAAFARRFTASAGQPRSRI
jgi:transcriptional regulator GlxA family with amidase domain